MINRFAKERAKLSQLISQSIVLNDKHEIARRKRAFNLNLIIYLFNSSMKKNN